MKEKENNEEEEKPEERLAEEAPRPRPYRQAEPRYVSSIAGIVAIVCVLFGVFIYMYVRGGKTDQVSAPVAGAPGQTAGLSTSILKIYYPMRTEFLAEDHQVSRVTKPHEVALAALKEFFKGPTAKRGDSLVPPAVEVLGTYMGTDGVLYIDLSSQLTANFQGDALGEHLFLKALYETLRNNVGPVPGGMRILVEGAEVDTLGGHISIYRGLEVAVGVAKEQSQQQPQAGQ